MPAPTEGALLDVRHLDKSFGVKIIDDLSVAVADGEALGIIGPNGAGKTTLLNLIAGDLRPDSGTVHFDGVDITDRSSDWRCRSGIGRTSQIPRPFEGLTVFENVLTAAVFGHGTPTSESDGTDVAIEALRRADLLRVANTPAGQLPLHALLAVVDRITAISFGAKIAEGEPNEVMASPQVQEVYTGVEPV